MAKFRLEGVKAALFDLAGTLVDSSRAITSPCGVAKNFLFLFHKNKLNRTGFNI